MSEAWLGDIKATKCIYFFYICGWFVVCDRCFSLICKIIKNWCVNIYSVSIFIIAQSETPQRPSPNPIFQKVFNGFLMAGKIKEKDVSFDEIFVGKIRSITKNSGKKECSNIDLWGKAGTFKQGLTMP